jgi:hypothetical protein
LSDFFRSFKIDEEAKKKQNAKRLYDGRAYGRADYSWPACHGAGEELHGPDG